MTSIDPAISAHAQRRLIALRHAPALFALTLFVSALLLFAVQPMFTKMVLPVLGGAPSVWSVAMVFFQAALLLGYAYAHLLARLLPPAKAALVHIGVLAFATVSLPIGIAAGFSAPPSHGIEFWLVALFAASIGLPFTALAASAPLLQSWFAVSGHEQSKNPYVLYAASNLGSFAALLLYPLLFEPLFTLHMQAAVWTFGFAMLTLLVGAAALTVSQVRAVPAAKTDASAAPGWRERFIWIALAAIPSGLVIAVTAHITTDVAAAPFLWVIPLALYLLTFVILFRDRPLVPPSLAGQLVPFVVALLSISVLLGDKTFWLTSIALNLIGFMVLTLYCHGELYARRPIPSRLTEFYLLVSVGGVIGGIFAGLIAPNLFSNTWEYPVLVMAAVLMLPGAFTKGVRGFLREAALPLGLAAVLTALVFLSHLRLPSGTEMVFQLSLAGLTGLMIWKRREPAKLFGFAVLAFAVTGFWQPGMKRIETARSFFGVHKILESEDRSHRLLFHGTTIHGAEKIRNDDGSEVTGKPEPITYYYFGGPYSDAFAAAREVNGNLSQVAVVGLGAGSLACHRKAEENWTFFEIDPEVVRIARDPKLFRFLSECAPQSPVVLGDARLTLVGARQQFNVIALDAFSSDAIPVHLLTREAFTGYLQSLAPKGMIVAHISNRHMDLAPVVGAVAASHGLVAYAKLDRTPQSILKDFKANALLAAIARSEADLGDLPKQNGWKKIEPGDTALWTDDYSNILGAIVAKKFAR
jgi:hypothetical protein